MVYEKNRKKGLELYYFLENINLYSSTVYDKVTINLHGVYLLEATIKCHQLSTYLSVIYIRLLMGSPTQL